MLITKNSATDWSEKNEKTVTNQATVTCAWVLESLATQQWLMDYVHNNLEKRWQKIFLSKALRSAFFKLIKRKMDEVVNSLFT